MSTTNNDNESSSTEATAASTSAGEELPYPKTMRIRDIKNELNGFNVASNDCFDKESLCLRLVDTRSGKVKGRPTNSSSNNDSADAVTNHKKQRSRCICNYSYRYNKTCKFQNVCHFKFMV